MTEILPADALHLALDIAVTAFAVGLIVMAARLQKLFRQGTAGRPIMVLAFSPVLMAAGEASHVLAVVWGIPGLDAFHDVLEAAFFVVMSIAAWSFARAWSASGVLTMGSRATRTMSESDLLISIVNGIDERLARIAGPRSVTRSSGKRSKAPFPDATTNRRVARS